MLESTRIAPRTGGPARSALAVTCLALAFGCGDGEPAADRHAAGAAGFGGSASAGRDAGGGKAGGGRTGGAAGRETGEQPAAGEGGEGGQGGEGGEGGAAGAAGRAAGEGGHAGEGTPSGGQSHGGEPANPGGQTGFRPVEGVDEGGRARRIGDAFYTAGQALLSPGDGSSWLLWRSYADPDFSGQAVYLEQFDAGGVRVRSSALAGGNPDYVALHADGSLTAVRNHCGPAGTDTCFARDDFTGQIRETVWPAPLRTHAQYRLDSNGDVVGSSEVSFDDLNATGAVAEGAGVQLTAWHGSQVLYRFDEHDAVLGVTELLPRVVPPELPTDAPIEELLRNADLAHQLTTAPVPSDEGVVVAATVARGTLAALNASRGAGLPLPDDPRCPDVVVLHLPEPGAAPSYFSVPTAGCERLPKVTVASGHAVVATVLRVEKTPEPNDTHQYDIGLGIVNLRTGAVLDRSIGLDEDDIVYALAPCGDGAVCLAGLTGARSVDTGSTVTMGDGFVLRVTLSGEVGERWTLTSPRHSEILALKAFDAGLLFYATVNGPITHTADGDPWLGFNEGMLGVIQGWPHGLAATVLRRDQP